MDLLVSKKQKSKRNVPRTVLSFPTARGEGARARRDEWRRLVRQESSQVGGNVLDGGRKKEFHISSRSRGSFLCPRWEKAPG